MTIKDKNGRLLVTAPIFQRTGHGLHTSTEKHREKRRRSLAGDSARCVRFAAQNQRRRRSGRCRLPGRDRPRRRDRRDRRSCKRDLWRPGVYSRRRPGQRAGISIPGRISPSSSRRVSGRRQVHRLHPDGIHSPSRSCSISYDDLNNDGSSTAARSGRKPLRALLRQPEQQMGGTAPVRLGYGGNLAVVESMHFSTYLVAVDTSDAAPSIQVLRTRIQIPPSARECYLKRQILPLLPYDCAAQESGSPPSWTGT